MNGHAHLFISQKNALTRIARLLNTQTNCPLQPFIELGVIYFIFLQIIWFTALFPYFVMTILLFRAITLEGASIGLMRYITPDWDKLYDSETWIDSATQVKFPN